MKKKWWQEAIVYEIYCKSFCDSDGDGIGDLRGVMSKLTVLRDLGINCIWFTPIYTSPQVDNGYDVADYRNIDPAYGTLDDFKELVDMAHGMGIRIIMDMVLNHSSDECEWFKESRKSKDNPYRNYYIWQPPKEDGSEPNNWGSYFREGNGSAWEFDETTGEYYLHQYSIKMPDLNWEYEPLRREIYDMLSFWIDLGVDGFRLDIFTRFKKPMGFPDTGKKPDPVLDRNGFVVDASMCTNVEGIHEILHELYTEVFGLRECMTVGEGAGVSYRNALDYVCASREEIDMVYHFDLAYRGRYEISNDLFRKVQGKWADVMKHDAWAVQYLSNHDSARQVSCYGCDSDEYRADSAKLLAAFIHTTPGTPFIYQGEEIGMTNVKYDSIEDYNCRYTVGDYHAMIASGVSADEAIDILAPRSRDNARTPYQWNGSENAGFTTGKPWIKVNPKYKSINLEADRSSEDSIFAFYQELAKMRREDPAIIDGELDFLLEDNEQIIMYKRACMRQTLLVVANYSGKTAKFDIPEEIRTSTWKRRLTNKKNTFPSLDGERDLLPWEIEIFELVR
ncbi:MAG: alpha-glucosidase [Ruminococcaceae bacterium]|nr:alpha-glucosidase [Oscillospiraceae bacterium]